MHLSVLLLCLYVCEHVLRTQTKLVLSCCAAMARFLFRQAGHFLSGGERKTGVGGRKRERERFSLHSYQLSRLMRLDWTIGIKQVSTVQKTGVTNKASTVQAANLPEAVD